MGLRRNGTSLTTTAQFVQDVKGRTGGLYVSDTATITGNFAVIHALTATVIATMTTEQPGIIQTPNGTTGVVTSVALAAGDEIFGDITTFALTSGTVIAYRRP